MSSSPKKPPNRTAGAAKPRETGRRVLEIESQAVAALAESLDETFDRAVGMLAACSGRVIVTGMGKSGIVCHKIAATLSSTGCPAYFMHPAEAIHGDLGMIVEGDLLVAISNSGETEEIVRLLELVRRLGVGIVGLSGNPESTLARHSDVHLTIRVDQEACSWDLVPTASSTAALAMGDALAVAAYEQRGFSPGDFARYHPGGRLARKLLKIDTLMHKGDDVPVVRTGARLADAIRVVNAKKLGMACVVDDNGLLVGVITDGDLRRRLLAVDRPAEGTIDEAMTRSPGTIGEEALASEALHMMEERKITSLPVIDAVRRLKGVIQIHDLWRTELF